MEGKKSVKEHKIECERINAIFALKNKKYGDSFHKTWDEYGPTMLCIRLDDKLSRAKQLLLHHEPGTEDESIIDTLQDLADYAIMGIMELRNNVDNISGQEQDK